MWWSDWLYFQHLITCMGGRAPAYYIQGTPLHSYSDPWPSCKWYIGQTWEYTTSIMLLWYNLQMSDNTTVLSWFHITCMKNFYFEKLLWKWRWFLKKIFLGIETCIWKRYFSGCQQEWIPCVIMVTGHDFFYRILYLWHHRHAYLSEKSAVLRVNGTPCCGKLIHFAAIRSFT